MNEAIQEMFKDCFIDVDFRVVELEALYTAWRAGAKADMNKDITANNIAYVTPDPYTTLSCASSPSNQAAPVGVNWSCYSNPDVDKLFSEAQNTFDPARQDALMARVHEKIVDDAVLIWVVHDVNPHALSPRSSRTSRPSTGFQDLTTSVRDALTASTFRIPSPPLGGEVRRGGYDVRRPLSLTRRSSSPPR